jgi:hypothetical protein
VARSSFFTNVLLCSDVFVLDMGDSVIAEELIRLSGLESDKDPHCPLREKAGRKAFSRTANS